MTGQRECTEHPQVVAWCNQCRCSCQGSRWKCRPFANHTFSEHRHLSRVISSTLLSLPIDYRDFISSLSRGFSQDGWYSEGYDYHGTRVDETRMYSDTEYYPSTTTSSRRRGNVRLEYVTRVSPFQFRGTRFSKFQPSRSFLAISFDFNVTRLIFLYIYFFRRN